MTVNPSQVQEQLAHMIEILGPDPEDISSDDAWIYLRESVRLGMSEELADEIWAAYKAKYDPEEV